jgi:hypothetical protein
VYKIVFWTTFILSTISIFVTMIRSMYGDTIDILLAYPLLFVLSVILGAIVGGIFVLVVCMIAEISQ